MKNYRALTPIAFFAIACTGTAQVAQDSLSLTERQQLTRAVEEVYARHRQSNPQPNLGGVSSQLVERKIADSLQRSRALSALHAEVTAAELQAEIDRMAAHSRAPQMLQELWAALGQRPLAIAEILARPIVVERKLRGLYGQMASGGNSHANFEAWVASLATRGSDDSFVAGSYQLPRLRLGTAECIKDSFAPLQLGTPSPRRHFTTVWTGTEMIVWGGRDNSGTLVSGGRYSPATDSWLAMTDLGAPPSHYGSTGLWTGTEMVIWGGRTLPGNSEIQTGGRYNPATDTWSAITLTGAPTQRADHTAVWTGTEMIVWGGSTFGGSLAYKDGAKYNPTTDVWLPLSSDGAPEPRSGHTAIWTGSKMVIWGGYGGDTETADVLKTGGQYNAASNSWSPITTTDAPAARWLHTAVWSGSDMIVWGGADHSQTTQFQNGARYNPTTNQWAAMSTSAAPNKRFNHTAVWAGSEMIVFGGTSLGTEVNSGGRYNPQSDAWVALNDNNAPFGRAEHGAIWTGTEMIVWGGINDRTLLNSGGRYVSGKDSWTATNAAGAPAERYKHGAIWTGSEMLIFGGVDPTSVALNDGARYTPATDSWSAVSNIDAPIRRTNFSLIWTGTDAIVWGGQVSASVNSGARYNPANDTWTATTTNGAPTARGGHSAVWTGTEMVVWGGETSPLVFTNSGGRYNPATDSWNTAPSTDNAPTGRAGHSAVWTGTSMIVWGGGNQVTGGIYRPDNNTWTATSTTRAPATRSGHTTVWTGKEMIVWGGLQSGVSAVNTGGRYNPTDDVWRDVATSTAPSRRTDHTAVWTGKEMIVWGGNTLNGPANDGRRYNPDDNSWTLMASDAALLPRLNHSAIWTGTSMIVWGGRTTGRPTATGGIYHQMSSQACATCTTDYECGSLSSGQICQAKNCVAGCRGQDGNGCATGLVCSSATAEPGQCVAPPDMAGEPDLATSGPDFSQPVDLADASVRDMARTDLNRQDGSDGGTAAFGGGGCSYVTVNQPSSATLLMLTVGLVGWWQRRRRNS